MITKVSAPAAGIAWREDAIVRLCDRGFGGLGTGIGAFGAVRYVR